MNRVSGHDNTSAHGFAFDSLTAQLLRLFILVTESFVAGHLLLSVGQSSKFSKMSLPAVFTRRDVVRQFALGMASCWLGGMWSGRFVLAAATPVKSEGRLTLKVSEFSSLLETGGSMHLSVGLDQPIIISRFESGFHVLSSRCTHNGCTVNPFDPLLGVHRCPCHGSRFAIDGSLLAGPATSGLRAFESTFDGGSEQLTVRLPEVTFAARSIVIHSINGQQKRVKLSFHANSFVDYQVHYQESMMSGSAAVVKVFATTAAGAATQTVYRRSVFSPADPQPLIDLYVDVTRASGFFSIVSSCSDRVSTAFPRSIPWRSVATYSKRFHWWWRCE